MKYSKLDLDFILYNNRSINGVVKNFINEFDFNPFYLYKLDERIKEYKQKWNKQKFYTLDTTLLDLNADDVIITPNDIKPLTNTILQSHKELLTNTKYKFELDWILNRGFNINILKKWKIGSIQYLVDNCNKHELTILGITTHPLLSKLLNTTLEGGGIILPQFKNNELINLTARRISDTGKLKYTQAVPDISVYGLNTCKSYKTIYITEGTFDMIALQEQGVCAVTVSSSIWSSLQLHQLLEKEVENIIIFSDNDKVGLSTSAVLKDILSFFDINIKTIVSKQYKDPCEHFLEHNLTFNETKEILITEELVNSKENVEFDIVNYLKNRKF